MASLLRAQTWFGLCLYALFCVGLNLSPRAVAATPSSAPETLENTLNVAAWVKQKSVPPVTVRAARDIAAAYEQCAIFYGPEARSGFFGALRRDVRQNDAQGNARIALANALYDRCEALLDRGATNVPALRMQWLEKAAAQGDISAKLALRQQQAQPAAALPAFRAEMAQALNSRDADAIWEAGRAAAWAGYSWRHLTGQPFPAGGKNIDGLQAVFQLAACELGKACGSDSVLIKNFCVRGTCGVKSYSDWLPGFMNAAQVAAVKAQLPRVFSAIKQGRGATLLTL
jgi:hypothetical protein